MSQDWTQQNPISMSFQWIKEFNQPMQSSQILFIPILENCGKGQFLFRMLWDKLIFIPMVDLIKKVALMYVLVILASTLISQTSFEVLILRNSFLIQVLISNNVQFLKELVAIKGQCIILQNQFTEKMIQWLSSVQNVIHMKILLMEIVLKIPKFRWEKPYQHQCNP